MITLHWICNIDCDHYSESFNDYSEASKELSILEENKIECWLTPIED